MLIRELEKNTGLERATIRFYEKEGLITPIRHENGYREYSLDDCDTLLKVKLLRQLGMPLEMIRGLQQGSEDFSTALTDQIHMVEHQIEDADRAKEVCLELRNAGATYEALDAAHYLHELTRVRPAEPAWTPQPVPEFRQKPLTHPWRRFFARLFDIWFLQLVVLLLLVVVFRIRPYGGIISFVAETTICLYLLLIPVEGLLIHYFRTTPGKWIMGIRIDSTDGGPLPLADAMRRCWGTLRYGYGFTIPLYQYWRLYRSYRDYKDLAYTDWDHESGAEIQFSYYWDGSKKAWIIALVLIYILGLGFAVTDSRRPVHRGDDLTVAQFAENFNDLIEGNMDEPTSNSDLYLNEDGTWKTFYKDNNGIYISLGGEMFVPGADGSREEGLNDFQYELHDGSLRKLTYDQGWQDVFMLSPLDGRPLYAVYAAASAQDWWNPLTQYELERQILEKFLLTDGMIVFENIEIIWSMQSENCSFSGGTFYDQDTGVSSVILHFEIIIHPEK